ncbi:MAG: hypothetical protein ABI995_05710 [Acidobacteriota bacterium]
MCKRGFAAGLAVLFVCGALLAKEPLLECGSYFTKAQEELFLHMRHTVRRAAARLASSDVAPRAARANQDAGEIAVIGSGNGVVGVRNPFDLGSKTISFAPDGAGYIVQSSADTFDAAASQAGTRLPLDDDDTERITLPFAFPFYGTTYTSAFVNSNGTLSFTAGDLDFSGAFGHFAGGPPAIAALFCDLNPPSSTNGVKLLSEPGRVVITWDNVPLSGDSFFNGGQTFQLRIYPTGRIELTYTKVTDSLANAVTGLNPGGLKPVTLTDLSAAPSTPFTTGVAESFTSSFAAEVDMMAAAQRFYQTHDDAYDYLVFYNAMGVSAGSGVVAYELTTRSAGDGYGDTPTNVGAEYGSKRQLQAVLNLGPTTQYPGSPTAPVPARATIGDTPLSILAHESGHLFLALVSVPSPSNSVFPPMLGAGLAHWAFPFNTDASFLEGNRIVDQGAQASPRFRTTGTVEHYSALDQYLMGFRAPQDVPPSFAVLNSGITNSRAPQVGVSFNGTKLDIPIEDVIKAAGRRTPDSTVAQRNFRFGFVMIVDENADTSPGSPAAAAIAQVDAYRAAFVDYYAGGTDFKGSISTTLRRNVDVSLAPASGVVLGGTANAYIELTTPSESAITFTIEKPQSIVNGPSAITIPAGSKKISFSLTGNRVGVEELRVVPSDARYHAAIARVQVNPASAIRVTVVQGDKQRVPASGALPLPIVVRVVDVNKLPYSNQTVTASVSTGGSLTPASAVTNEFGEATFVWTPAPGSFNSINFGVPGVPSSNTIATALGKPGVLTGGVVNAANYTVPVGAGGFGSIFGGSLAGGVVAKASGPNFPTTLSGVRVTINGAAVSLSYVSDSQINFIAPANIAAGTAQLAIETPLGVSAAIPIQIAAVAPGVFFDAATGNGAVLIAGTGLTTQVRAAKAGDFLEIYCTGLGISPVATVTIAGLNAEVTYAGPTVVQGLQQVNVKVPTGLPPGPQDLLLKVSGISGNSVRVQLQ